MQKTRNLGTDNRVINPIYRKHSFKRTLSETLEQGLLVQTSDHISSTYTRKTTVVTVALERIALCAPIKFEAISFNDEKYLILNALKIVR